MNGEARLVGFDRSEIDISATTTSATSSSSSSPSSSTFCIATQPNIKRTHRQTARQTVQTAVNGSCLVERASKQWGFNYRNHWRYIYAMTTRSGWALSRRKKEKEKEKPVKQSVLVDTQTHNEKDRKEAKHRVSPSFCPSKQLEFPPISVY